MPTNNAQLGTNYRCVNRKYLTSLGLNASNNEKLLVGSDITDTFRANIVNIINKNLSQSIYYIQILTFIILLLSESFICK